MPFRFQDLYMILIFLFFSLSECLTSSESPSHAHRMAAGELCSTFLVLEGRREVTQKHTTDASSIASITLDNGFLVQPSLGTHCSDCCPSFLGLSKSPPVCRSTLSVSLGSDSD